MYARMAAQLHEMGWPTIPVLGKRPVATNWQHRGEYMPHWQEIFINARQYPAANIGLPLGRASGVVALDLDIDDYVLQGVVQELAEAILGATAVRMGKPSRVVMLYQSDLPTRRMGKVELLGQGTQVVIYGQHPDGYWYRWIDEEPFTMHPQDLPRLYENSWNDFIEALHDTLPEEARIFRREKRQIMGTPFDSSALWGARHGRGSTWYRSVARQLSDARPGALHNTMVSAISALVNKGLDDERILEFVKTHFNAPTGGVYAEVWDQIEPALAGARRKHDG